MSDHHHTAEDQALDDHHWMGICIADAQRAAELGEVPVAAIVVSEGRIIGRGYNLRECTGDPTAHAEIVALRDAARTVGFWRVLDSTLYVTLEPCPMCAGALVNSRVTRLVYGAPDPKAGAVDSLYSITTDPRLNHRLEVLGGVREAECAELLRAFFRARRGKKRKAVRREPDSSKPTKA
ncbi:MAG: tRNA adenosine(34) deaminase TadA [Bradymonadia bacterium]